MAETVRTFSRDVYYNFFYPWSGSDIALAIGVPVTCIVMVLVWAAVRRNNPPSAH